MNNDLYQVRSIYNTLTKLANYSLSENKPYDEIIRYLFEKIRGKVRINGNGHNYSYDGYVDTYTISGIILESSYEADFYRLIEDLTMAYYKNNGGTEYTYTPHLIDAIKKL